MKIKKNSKIKILLLGYSYIARKAVIKAMESNPSVALIGIASQSNYEDLPSSYTSYDSYEEAIKNSDCDVVYISLHNSAHYEWIIKSLKNNKHVMCDKPAVLNRKEALECYKEAGKSLLLFESMPYLYHTQHGVLKKYIGQQSHPLQKITAHFGFPALNPDNFRNFAHLGGGCLYDIGPYMTSVGQLYFNKPARQIYCNAYLPKGHVVPTSASVMIQYGENQILQGHFGFQLEYRNHLNLWGENFNFSVDRAFTIPPDVPNNIAYKTKDTIKNIPVPPCNHFSEMFTHFSGVFHNKSGYQRYNRLFLEQAIQLDTMIQSAETKNLKIVKCGI